MSDAWTPPSAPLTSHYLWGGLWGIRPVLSTYCVPGIVFDTSPHGGQTDNAYKSQEECYSDDVVPFIGWDGGYLDHAVREGLCKWVMFELRHEQ